MNTPKISVIMPVYNAEKYLAAAIESILNQTYDNFELIIINDGSTDNSMKVIKRYQDKRIKLVNQKNQGLVKSLNSAITEAKGEYIGRQDADDYSHPQRLEKQLKFMEENQKVALLGTNYEVIYPDGKRWFVTNMFTHPDDLKLAIIFSNQIGHGTVMVRKKILEITGYDSSKVVEDYDLWTRLVRHNQIANLKDCLYSWRYYPESLSTSNQEGINEDLFGVINREFEYFGSHKSEYKIFSFHPNSVNGSFFKYSGMKNSQFRNMALLYCKSGYRLYAASILLLAFVYAPWRFKNYKFAKVILFNRKNSHKLNYETYLS